MSDPTRISPDHTPTDGDVYTWTDDEGTSRWAIATMIRQPDGSRVLGVRDTVDHDLYPTEEQLREGYYQGNLRNYRNVPIATILDYEYEDCLAIPGRNDDYLWVRVTPDGNPDS